MQIICCSYMAQFFFKRSGPLMHGWCFEMKLRVDDTAIEVDDISLTYCLRG